MQVRIFRPTKTAMQSGLGGTKRWRLAPDYETPRKPEPLMGWTAAGDPFSSVGLDFPTVEAAVAFAKRQGWDYTVAETTERQPHPRSYADNFKPGRPKAGRF